MKFRNRSGVQKGFSLIELMIVIFILSIGIMISVGPLTQYIDNSHLTNAVDGLSADIAQARQSAMTENRNYVIVFYSTGYSEFRCTATGASCTSGFSLIKAVKYDAYGSGTAFVSISGGSAIAFKPRGVVDAQHTVTLTNSRGSTATIVVSITGRPSVNIVKK